MTAHVIAAYLRTHQIKGQPARGTPGMAVAAVVAPDDAADFPPLERRELLARDAYLAHKLGV